MIFSFSSSLSCSNIFKTSSRMLFLSFTFYHSRTSVRFMR
nr:MAG TPA: hypothetical protein [Caudoviricetes sp.]